MKLRLETLVEKYKEGEVYYTNLVEQQLKDSTNGIYSHNFIIIQTLRFLLKVLEIKIKYQDLSDNTLILLRRLLEIIGGFLDEEDLDEYKYVFYLDESVYLGKNIVLISKDLEEIS